MLKKHIGAGVLALGLLFSVGFVAAPAQAASLTSAQVSAIIGLLQSFGADQATINNVSVALGGSSTNGALSCSSFADVHYGNFDNDAGGRVSQLQTFLGISSTAFGFGTYGPKTQAAWNTKCGGTTTTSPTTSTSSNFTASPTSGSAPLTVTFAANLGAQNRTMTLNFGDGTSNVAVTPTCTNDSCTVTNVHTYSSSGTYTASLTESAMVQGIITFGTVVITVFDGQKGSSSSANFTVSPTSGSAPLTAAFSTSGSQAQNGSINFGDGNSIRLLTLFGNGTTNSAGYCGAAPDFACYVPHTYSASGTYTAQLEDSSGNIIGTQTITVFSGQKGSSPSATIDQSSLNASTNGKDAALATITGTALNVPYIRVWISDKAGVTKYDSGVVGVSGSQWSVTASSMVPGSYTVQVYGYANTTGASQGASGLLASGTLTVTGNNSIQSSILSATPTSGSAPLTVTFSGGGTGGNPANGPFINFGDGSTNVQMGCISISAGGACAGSYTATHTYTSTGVFTAQVLSQATGGAIGTATVTVFSGQKGSSPSATIDQSSLNTGTASPTITGTASNTVAMCMWVYKSGVTPVQNTANLTSGANLAGQACTPAAYDGQEAVMSISNGHWSISFPQNYFQSGTYNVAIYNESQTNFGNLLASGTLTVN